MCIRSFLQNDVALLVLIFLHVQCVHGAHARPRAVRTFDPPILAPRKRTAKVHVIIMRPSLCWGRHHLRTNGTVDFATMPSTLYHPYPGCTHTHTALSLFLPILSPTQQVVVEQLFSPAYTTLFRLGDFLLQTRSSSTASALIIQIKLSFHHA